MQIIQKKKKYYNYKINTKCLKIVTVKDVFDLIGVVK